MLRVDDRSVSPVVGLPKPWHPPSLASPSTLTLPEGATDTSLPGSSTVTVGGLSGWATMRRMLGSFGVPSRSRTLIQKWPL